MTEKLWGARFAQDITCEVLDYTATVEIDVRLLPFELWQDLAHTVMLTRQGVVPAPAARSILGALLDLEERRSHGDLRLDARYEDVHLNVEQLVIQRVGIDAGGRMHTARSRNDQVSTDTRMYLRTAQLEAVEATLGIVEELLFVDDADYLTVLPGYTHSQAAQPISVAFWRTAHASMLLRDVARLRDAFGRTNESPLGGCALAGTSFDIDRTFTADLLGFDRLLRHALDATSARDYLIEAAAALAIAGNGMSRIAEELVVWSGSEHRLCDVGDEFCTGSSIMPQKKNPVVAELIRGRAGRSVGTLVQLLTAVKGVTLGYSCDLQEDKPFLWDAVDTHLSTARILAGQVRALRFDLARGEELCWENFSTATELANHLVADRGLPFRQAHRVVGSLVADLLEQGLTLAATGRVSLLLAAQGHDVSPQTLQRLLSPRAAIAGSTSEGGTSPTSVAATRGELLEAATKHKTWAIGRAENLRAARAATLRAAGRIVEGVHPAEALDPFAGALHG